MADQTTDTQGTTVNISRENWSSFLNDFTRQNRGTRAQLEVLGGDAGRIVETEGRTFDGISIDYKDGEDAVWITFEPGGTEHLTHGIQQVTAIRMRTPAGRAGAALEIEAGDGTKTLLELSPPRSEDLLPPGTK